MSLAKTFIGSVGNAGGASVLTLPSYDQPAGELIVLFSEINTAGGVTETAPTDTANNTYVALLTPPGYLVGPYGHSLQVWYCENCLGSATNVIQQNSQYPSYNNYAGFVGWHVSGAALSGSADTSSTAYGAVDGSFNGSSGAFTTTQADEVLFSVVCRINATAVVRVPQVGWDDDTVGGSDVLSAASQIASTLQVAQTMTWNTIADNTSIGIVVATFKAVAAPSTYPVSGVILDGSSNPIVGATVSCTGQTDTTTASDGSYGFTGLSGSVTVTPSKTGYTFAPTHIDETGADGAADFVATLIPTVATPTFSPVAGAYGPTQNVTISDTDNALAGFQIYYTTNGDTPDNTKTAYTYGATVSISATHTLKAIAYATGYSASAVGSALYTINGAVATPTFSPAAGTYGSAQNVTISDTDHTLTGFQIYYTTDGTTPDNTKTAYTYGTTVAISATCTLKAIAYATGYSDSAVGSALYTINIPAQVAVPTFSPPAGGWSAPILVDLADTDSGLAGFWIQYTTDGSTPTFLNGTTYLAPIAVSTTTTIKAIALAAGYTPSAVASATYVIGSTPTPPTPGPSGGYASAGAFLTIPDKNISRDYLHLLDSLGNVIGWIGADLSSGGSIDPTSTTLPTQYATVTIPGDPSKDYLHCVDQMGNVIFWIDATGAFQSTGNPLARAEKVYVGNPDYDFLHLLDVNGDVLVWIDCNGQGGITTP